MLPERVQTILGKGFANREAFLSEDDSLSVLSACVEIGQRRAEVVKGKAAVIVTGNTGAGKSTFVNYMMKCTLEKVSLENGGKTQKVYMVSEKSRVKEVMQIGHSKMSHSFVPELAEATDMNACIVDCPGFLDNRGPEISIANAANIKAVMALANGVKLVILLNYHSLQADRGRGQSELIDMIQGLFGSVDRAIEHASSMILVVSRVPLSVDGDPVELQDVMNEFDTSVLSPDKARFFDILLGRACIFHPEDKGGKSWLRAESLSERIMTTTPIMNPENVFKIILSGSDEAKLRNLMDALLKRFHVALHSSDNEIAAKALTDMMRLNFLDHVVVTRLLENAKTEANKTLQHQIHEAQGQLMLDKTEDAAAFVVTTRAILEAFSASKAAQEMIDLVDFASRIDTIENAIEDRRKEKVRLLEEHKRNLKEREEGLRKLREANAKAEAAEAKAAEERKAFEEERQRPRHRCGHAYCGKRYATGLTGMTAFTCSPDGSGDKGAYTAGDAAGTAATGVVGGLGALLSAAVLPITAGVVAAANAPNAYGYIFNGKCCKCRGFKS